MTWLTTSLLCGTNRFEYLFFSFVPSFGSCFLCFNFRFPFVSYRCTFQCDHFFVFKFAIYLISLAFAIGQEICLFIGPTGGHGK